MKNVEDNRGPAGCEDDGDAAMLRGAYAEAEKHYRTGSARCGGHNRAAMLDEKADAAALALARANRAGTNESGYDKPAPSMQPASQHTPDLRPRLFGRPPLSLTPWRVVNNCNVFEVWTREDVTPGSRNNYIVAEGIQSEADANALAAAPDLLAALRLASEYFDKTAPESGRSIAARAAIAKADGRKV